jgi:hypothetical protein
MIRLRAIPLPLPVPPNPPLAPMTETTIPEAPAEGHASLWEDFLDIFYAPREVFARRRNAGFGLVLLIITLLITAIFYASQGPLADAMAAEFQRTMARSGNAAQMTPEQLATARRTGAIFGTIGILIVFPLSVALTGVLLWAMGKLFDFAGSVAMAILIVTYAQFPRVLQGVAGLLQGLLLQPDTLAGTSVGPARFFDPDTTSAMAMALLMRLDLFYIWSTVLIAIGAQVIARVPRARSYVLAVLVWVVGAIPQVAGAMAAGLSAQ